METTHGLVKAYRRIVLIAKICLIFSISLATIVELIQTLDKSFEGLVVISQIQKLTYTFALIICLGVILHRRLKALFLKKHFADSEPKLISKLKTASLFTLALCQLPSILGFFLFLLTGISREFYVFLVCSIIMQITYYPSYHQWEKWFTTQ